MNDDPHAESLAVEGIDPTLCPGCGGPGKRVTRATLDALLTPEARLASLGELDTARYCGAAGCDIVYWTGEPPVTRTVGDVAVEVFDKTIRRDRPVCYCFGFTVAEVEADTEGTIATDIAQRCRDGLDRCETTSPSGRCCLGAVRRLTKRASATGPRTEPDPEACCARDRAVTTSRPPGPTASRSRAPAVTVAGAVLAAVLSSACCWLPLALAGAGVSAAGAGAAFEVYRPYALGLAGVLLAAGFWFVYLRRAPCEPGTACERSASSGASRAARVSLWSGALLVVAAATFPTWFGWTAPAAAKVGASARAYDVAGMHCAGCAGLVRDALADLPGVDEVRVTYEPPRVCVAGPASGATLVRAAADVGYQLTPAAATGCP